MRKFLGAHLNFSWSIFDCFTFIGVKLQQNPQNDNILFYREM